MKRIAWAGPALSSSKKSLATSIKSLIAACALAAACAGAGAAVAQDAAGCGPVCLIEGAIESDDVGDIGPGIEQVLAGQGWRITEQSPGLIDAHIEQRGQRADIRVTYDERAYRIAHHRSSENLSARGYSRWAAKLNNGFQRRLNAPSGPPQRSSENSPVPSSPFCLSLPAGACSAKRDANHCRT